MRYISGEIQNLCKERAFTLFRIFDEKFEGKGHKKQVTKEIYSGFLPCQSDKTELRYLKMIQLKKMTEAHFCKIDRNTKK